MDANFKYKIESITDQDLINKIEGKTVYQKIYLYLKRKGYEVYSVGQKRDKCTNTYIVIKENGTHALDSNVNGYKIFDIIIYCPKDKYSQTEIITNEIKEIFKNKQMTQYLRPTGNETPIILDGEIEGYTTSIQYQQFKKI